MRKITITAAKAGFQISDLSGAALGPNVLFRADWNPQGRFSGADLFELDRDHPTARTRAELHMPDGIPQQGGIETYVELRSISYFSLSSDGAETLIGDMQFDPPLLTPARSEYLDPDDALGLQIDIGAALDDALVNAKLIFRGGKGDDYFTPHLTGDHGAEGVVLTGGKGHDTLTGLSGDDILRGGRGNDTLFDDSGQNQLFGGRGHDHIRLGDGAGGSFAHGGKGRDVLISEDGGDTLSGGAGRDTLAGGAGRDTLLGGAGRDLLRGGAHADHLDGGRGDDRLIGGGGADMMTGGAGRDTFIFSSYMRHTDTITDFTPGTDHITVRGLSGGFNALDIQQMSEGTQVYWQGSPGGVFLKGIQADDLSESDFSFS